MRTVLFFPALGILLFSCSASQNEHEAPDLSGFYDSAHHWYDIHDEGHVIDPLPQQKKYGRSDVQLIADNILLYQKSNGGWPKNYDMAAILTPEQQERLLGSKSDTMATTIDNGATHSQVAYLARAFTRTRDDRHRDACLRGIEYLLQAQYANGGWPQFYPDRSGYRRYITFNDGAMMGVLEVFGDISMNRPAYSFIDASLRERVKAAYERGIACILQCQVTEQSNLTVWGQQHDDVTLKPRNARTFELASLCSQESAEITGYLMSIKQPSPEVVRAIEGAIRWFQSAAIDGLRVDTIEAPKADYMYHSTTSDRMVVKDSLAPRVWARFYELGTGRPLFANRDGKPVYSLAEVDRERRTGYNWYTNDPEEILKKYERWKQDNTR